MRLRYGVGLKGAAARAKHDDARTAGASAASDEDRGESREPSRPGLWSLSPRRWLIIPERLGLCKCLLRASAEIYL